MGKGNHNYQLAFPVGAELRFSTLNSQFHDVEYEAGCDEAGRGCLAGSVYAAAVIFPKDYQNEEINDSKQLTDKRRHELRAIIERDALAWAVGIVTPEEIDKINILNASILAMHRALDQLISSLMATASSLITTFPIRPSSRATPSICLSRQQASLPRPIATTIWTSWLRNTPSTTGSRTRATPQRNTVRQ